MLLKAFFPDARLERNDQLVPCVVGAYLKDKLNKKGCYTNQTKLVCMTRFLSDCATNKHKQHLQQNKLFFFKPCPNKMVSHCSRRNHT